MFGLDLDKELIKQIFGWTGTALAIIFFLTPAVPIYRLVNEQKKINEIPGLMLICSFMNCILWADYGLLDDAVQVYVANGIGGAISLIWITLLMAGVGGISYVFYFIINKDITGLCAMVFNVLMYAAPGEKIFRVCKTKQYDLIPIFSTIGGFFCSLCWLMFGVYKNDLKLIIPNGLGLFFAILQVIVYLVFYCKKKKEEDFSVGDDDNFV